MRKLLTILFALLTLQSFAATGNVTYYLSTANGDDSRTATQATNQSTPWKTISKLNANWSIIKPGDKVLFNSGETFPGTISPTVSGSAGLPITIGAYGTGARPVISSLTTLSGWTSNGSGIYTSATNNNLLSAVNIVFVNGEPVKLGRYPNLDATNKGYLIFETATSTSLTDNQLTGTPNWTGADVVVRSRNWVLDRATVTTHSTTTLTFPAISYTPKQLFGYFFENDIKCLDQPFEWAYNANTASKTVTKLDGTSTTLAAKSISMYFGANNPSSYTIQASNASRGIELTVSGQHDITIQGLSVYGANNDGIYSTSNKVNIKIIDCEINGVGGTGINKKAGSMIDCAIKNCTIRNCYNNGIDLNGTRDTVINNLVRDIYSVAGMGGSGDGQGIGIKVLKEAAYIANNKVRNIGYIGINFGDEGNGNKVINNVIDSFAIVKDDGGGIYTYNCPTGTTPIESDGHIVDGNIISNGIGVKEGTTSSNSSAEGIYLDGKSRGVTITNNTIYNVTDHALFFNNTRRVKARFNTAYNCFNYAYFSSYDSTTANSKIDKSNVFAQNTFFSVLSKERVLKFLSKFSDWQNWGKIDSNYYCRPLNEPDNTTSGSLGIIELQTAPGARYTSYVSSFYSLDLWKKQFDSAYDARTKKTATTILSASEVLFKVDTTGVKSVVDLLGKTYIDHAGVSYTKGNFTLPAFSSKILIATPNVPLDVTKNAAPSISLTAPADSQQYTAPAIVNISATASDADGFVTKVQFYNGNTLLNVDSVSPYSFSWTGVQPGSYNITAKATDNSGNVKASSAAGIVVNAPLSAPSVSLTSPDNNASYQSPATITVTAAATDADGTITKVEFYRDTTLIHTETNAPYTWNWVGVGVGTYNLTAKAYDNSGLKTTSGSRTVIISAATPTNQPPTVSLSSPITGTLYTAPATINISATAVDNDGSVTSVSFYNGSTLLGTDNTSPYTYAWSSVAVGSYSITAKATDNSGAVGSSASVTVTVNPAPIAPSVSLTSPVNNTNYTSPATINISASASDPDGTITKVDFYNGNTLLFSDNTSPYSYTWTGVPNGSYSITAKATDNSSLTATSASLSVSVSSPANIAPSVSLTGPANNSSFTQPVNLSITASASDADGTISKVDFYSNGAYLGTDATSPYSYSWNTIPAGSFKLTAIATDNSGAATTSNTVNITVIAPNVAPTATITSPTANASFVSPATILISANATDADGYVSSVKFYSGSTLLQTVTTSPFEFSWTNVAPGSYNLTAVATDNQGATYTSQSVNINVRGLVAPSVSITSPVQSAYLEPANVLLSANATDADGTVTKVEFYSNNVLVNTDATAPYSYTLTGLTAGTYDLMAKAYDNDGQVTSSSVFSIVVNRVKAAPSVSLTGPAIVPYSDPANLNITANASDNDGTISYVAFYANNVLIGKSFTPPYAITYSSAMAGTYNLTAKAVDNDSLSTISAVRTITVVHVNIPPAVSIIDPANGATFTAQSFFNITAAASDIDGSVSKVSFYDGSSLLATVTDAPYTVNVRLKPGVHTITAKAYDNNGAITSTSVVIQIVKANIRISGTAIVK